MGCLKNLFAMIGFITFVAIGSAVGWHYRAELKEMYLEFRGQASSTATSDASVGHPSDDALRSANRRNAEMEMPDGPATVTLTANEMASLIQQGIARGAADSFDSLTVTLELDRITLNAAVMTEVFARDLLGQFASLLDRSEHLRVSGPVEVIGSGVMGWEPDALRLRSFPFPGPAIGPMVNAITGGPDGAFRIMVPGTVGDVRVRPDGVTFYRRTD